MTANRDDLEVPHAVCKECKGYVPVVTMERGKCADCAELTQLKTKKKGYRNDIHSSNEASE